MVILGFLLSIMVYANTQEKIIQAKTHVVQVKFIDAIRAVAKINISGSSPLPGG